uniref:Plexin-B1 n=1 Tax=Nothobranchius furzeri TaxID=105023 RepID=A0A8C6Q655_NOTFU
MSQCCECVYLLVAPPSWSARQQHLLHFSNRKWFSRNDTEFQHLVLHPDPSVGTVYVGARDHLFQLDGSGGLRLEQEETTGPVNDNRECLPPVTVSNCPQARRTSNHNKLLLVEPKASELITCGSIYQGTCQKRSLKSIKTVLFSTERPVDTQYVAANDPLVSTVGLVVELPSGKKTVMYVGRGYTSSHPPISTRHLSSEPVFNLEDTAKLAVAGRLSEYDHHFVTTFTRRSYVYFLFYRRDIKSVSREYRTYAARVCLEDTSYYSYVEVPLVCRSPSSPSRIYNLLQAAQVCEDLLGVFSTRIGSTDSPLDPSALCVFPLDELDRHINSTRDLCYTKDGLVEGRGEVAYIEYEVKSSCANLPLNTLNAYPCGSDHTPSPMASKDPLEATAVWQTSAARLTAVAVSVREVHSIAFLGDARGNLHKVFLPQQVYADSVIHPNSPINSDLLLDQNGSHIYIMTRTTRPVAECGAHLDCQSCLSARDPYCGWCVLEGRCGQRWECQRGSLQGQWLWSFNQTQQCLGIQRLSLYNISRGEKTDIALSVEGLPNLKQGEAYSCFFQDTETPALLTTAGVICSTPDASSLCQGCVSSRWGCNWCIREHVCTHRHTCSQGFTIYNQHVMTLFNCSVSRSDCSRCRTADPKYGCVWCGGAAGSRAENLLCFESNCQNCCICCVFVFQLDPVSGPVEGGTVVTISGSNLGQRAEDIENSVTVAGVLCNVIHSRYEVSSRIVCETGASRGERVGPASVEVRGGGLGRSAQTFSFQNPALIRIFPQRGPKAGGSILTIEGRRLKTGHPSEVSVLIGGVLNIQEDKINCRTRGSNRTGVHNVAVRFGGADRHLEGLVYQYTPDPNITKAAPSKSFLSGGRIIRVSGHNLDVVQGPKMRVTLSPPDGTLCRYETRCMVNNSSLIMCPTPAVGPEAKRAKVKVHFLLDSLQFDFSNVSSEAFSYEPNPKLHKLNKNDPSKPYHHKPGSIISVEGEFLDLAMFKQEVEARIGEGTCVVKTLTHNHLYCEPPAHQPSVPASQKQDGLDSLPEFTVRMGNLNFSLGRVQYDIQAQSTFPLEAQVGVGVGASIVALIVLIIVLIYRRKSKQAMRDYKKVQIQLENLETSVRDRCKKEFTDLMTEMMDMSSDLVGSGIPFLDYRAYAERIFFPGHQESPLRRDLDIPESRRQTVEQGLVQLSNLLNSKLFLTKFIHTLETQRTFSPRDRAYVASLLTVALHGKLEYFTDILKTLLNDLVEQYVAKNPKLMLRRTESVVEKLLTNWMSICLFTFLRESAGESFYTLFRAIKHQVDKGPVDAVTGKAKYTLNDNRLLREDVEYRTLTLNVVTPTGAASGGTSSQTVPAKVLDCDTITQVKEKVLEQTWKGTSFSQRPHVDSLHLEWRAGVAGHLILSDEDLTSVVQGSWKRLNTLQHYKVPDGATVALVPRNPFAVGGTVCLFSSETPMLDDGEEGGVRLWHLVKASDESELPKHRRGSVREKGGERAKAIPEIFLTRLLSMKGTLQKFVDDLFTAILSTSRPVPLAVKYFFDLLDEQALQHSITDPETIHIWKTNSLPLRFWINILKNPQFIFDVQTSDNVDAVLSVISQTFMDSCTVADHKLGRDSPINKLLYARDIPRYKQMVERYYADIRQTIPASDQEMNSALAELSRNYTAEVNCLVALYELYKYINKYYDQIITALEEDSTAQKMQLGYRLQQIAAALENKVTDL